MSEPAMKIMEILVRDALILNLGVRSKREVLVEMANALAKVEPQTQGGGRAGARVFTGTIPDYATDAKGLLLGGVVGGGPAEAAGLRKGDVVVEIAGQAITNIYDYTYVLEILKIGEPVQVRFVRNGQQKETTLTPAARR